MPESTFASHHTFDFAIISKTTLFYNEIPVIFECILLCKFIQTR